MSAPAQNALSPAPVITTQRHAAVLEPVPQRRQIGQHGARHGVALGLVVDGNSVMWRPASLTWSGMHDLLLRNPAQLGRRHGLRAVAIVALRSASRPAFEPAIPYASRPSVVQPSSCCASRPSAAPDAPVAITGGQRSLLCCARRAGRGRWRTLQAGGSDAATRRAALRTTVSNGSRYFLPPARWAPPSYHSARGRLAASWIFCSATRACAACLPWRASAITISPATSQPRGLRRQRHRNSRRMILIDARPAGRMASRPMPAIARARRSPHCRPATAQALRIRWSSSTLRARAAGPRPCRSTISPSSRTASTSASGRGCVPGDRVLVSVPLFWSYGAVNALPAALTHGATLVLQGRFEPGEAFDLIERHDARRSIRCRR